MKNSVVKFFLVIFSVIMISCNLDSNVDVIPPQEVLNFEINVEENCAHLSWIEPNDLDYAGVEIVITTGENNFVDPIKLDCGTTSYTIENLQFGEKYNFTIKTFDKYNNFSNGKTIHIEIIDEIPPQEVSSFEVNITDDCVLLSWIEPSDLDYAGVEILITPTLSIFESVLLDRGNTSYFIGGLIKGEVYTITIRTFDKNNNFSNGSFIEIVIDETPPENVTDLSLLGYEDGILLTWTDSIDDDINFYEITWKETCSTNVSDKNTIIVGTEIQCCFVNNLNNNTEYEFIVTTVDITGNRSLGVSIIFFFENNGLDENDFSITLSPNIIQKTNQDVIIDVVINSNTEIEKVFYKKGVIENLDEILTGSDITDKKQFKVNENATYTVGVVDILGNSRISYITVSNIDKEIPNQVSNVRAEFSNDSNEIYISWDNPYYDDDFVGGEIWYKKNDSEDFQKLTFDRYTSSAVIENIEEDVVEYKITIVTKDFVGNFNDSQSLTIRLNRAKFTEIEIPIIGEGYLGEIPVSIIGENLDGKNFFHNEKMLTNVNYISSNKVVVMISVSEILDTNSITIMSGTSSITGNISIVEKEKCFYVGDILFVDGTRIKAENVKYGIPDIHIEKAFAIIVSAPYGGAIGKAVGLEIASDLIWAPSETTGYNTDFIEIGASFDQYDKEFSGDLDGYDNWKYICEIDPEGVNDASHTYPAFNYANNYGKLVSNLSNTQYENNWYLPTINELYDVLLNKEMIQTSLDYANGFNLGIKNYWSSSQLPYNNNKSGLVSFDISRGIETAKKNKISCVMSFHNFKSEDFEEYKVDSTPSITDITIPVVGEGYTGEVPITITGINLTGHQLSCDEMKFSSVKNLNDTKVVATVMSEGIVGKNTITIKIGASEYMGTIHVIEKKDCFSVGDIVFTDGTRITAEKVKYGIPDTKINNAFGVVASVSYGGGVGNVVGLRQSNELGLMKEDVAINFVIELEKIAVSYAPYSVDNNFKGDIAGSDNWGYICNFDENADQIAEINYPAFYFAKEYGRTTENLINTKYETGWYIPSIKELYDVANNKDIIQTSLNKVYGSYIKEGEYWGSSTILENSPSMTGAYAMYFANNTISGYHPEYNHKVLVLRSCNVSEFSEFEINSIPIITEVQLPNIGVNYVGDLPITIIGENLRGHIITINNYTCTSFDPISDNEVKVKILCNGQEQDNEKIEIKCGNTIGVGEFSIISQDDIFNLGDILFTDGTRIKAENIQYGIPDAQLKNAFAVVTSTLYNGGSCKAIGLHKSPTSVNWAEDDTIGYKSFFGQILCETSNLDETHIYNMTIQGDFDGSDNWKIICQVDKDGVKQAEINYPVFYFATQYGDLAGLTDTEYATGWYIPSLVELRDVYINRETIETSLCTLADVSFLENTFFWSSTQSYYNSYVFRIGFDQYFDCSHDNKANKSNYALVINDFNRADFKDYEYKTPVITNVLIPTAGEGYVGEIPIVIHGENLKGFPVFCNDLNFSNIDYISDTKVTATISCDGIVGEKIISVTSETSTKEGTLKVVETEKCFSVGDILFTDGTRIKASNVQYGIPDEQLDKAFAVIVSTYYEGGFCKAVGLQRSGNTQWAPNGTTGYNTNFTGIQCSYYWDSDKEQYIYTGDLDSSDNWDYICSIDPAGTLDASSNYPLFDFANNYGKIAGLNDTNYADGWYIPNIAELEMLFLNKEIIHKSFLHTGELSFLLGISSFWSSTQHDLYKNEVYCIDSFGQTNLVKKDGVHFNHKEHDGLVFKTFNSGDFKDYEYKLPIISEIVIPIAGEGYIGEIPVTIYGTNLKGNSIICSDPTFSNISYVSNEKVIATVICDGISGSKAITILAGNSSKDVILRVLPKSDCATELDIGKIILSDGSFISAEEYNPTTMKGIAIIAGLKYGGGQVLGLGNISSYGAWALEDSLGYYTKFDNIQIPRNLYTISEDGDIDGSDNWDYICSVDPKGTVDAATNYPAFDFANNYGITADLLDTDFANDWYIPSAKELLDISKSYATQINESRSNMGLYTLPQSCYCLSSTQEENATYYCKIYFLQDSDSYNTSLKNKYEYTNILVVRIFDLKYNSKYK